MKILIAAAGAGAAWPARQCAARDPTIAAAGEAACDACDRLGRWSAGREATRSGAEALRLQRRAAAALDPPRRRGDDGLQRPIG